MDAMTQAEYARHRGVSRQMVGKLIATGKLPADAFIEQRGQRKIDPVKADFALGQNQERVLVRDEIEREDDTFGTDTGAGRGRGGAGGRLLDARTMSESYRAGIAKLEFEARLGKLRPVADIEAAAVKCAEVTVRALQDKLLRIDQVVAVAIKDGVPGVRRVMNEIIFAERDAIARAYADLLAAEQPAEEQQVA